jgi:hypothetical protein
MSHLTLPQANAVFWLLFFFVRSSHKSNLSHSFGPSTLEAVGGNSRLTTARFCS